MAPARGRFPADGGDPGGQLATRDRDREERHRRPGTAAAPVSHRLELRQTRAGMADVRLCVQTRPRASIGRIWLATGRVRVAADLRDRRECLAGKAVVRELREHGYDVAATDIATTFGEDDAVGADLTDYGQAAEAVSGRKWNLWGYVDERDVALSCRLALEADATAVAGSPSFIAAADTVMNQPSAELMASVFPGVPLTSPVAEFGTLLSIDRARKVLGYQPGHSWRDHVSV
jgi:hypothetical protein